MTHAGPPLPNAPFRVVPQTYEPAVDVMTLFVHPKNAREHDVGRLHESIAGLGFIGSIIVWKHRDPLFGVKLPKGKRWVLAGAGRLGRALALDATTIPAMVVDIDAETAEKYVLADNRVSQDAGFNTENLLFLIQARLEVSEDIDAALMGSGYNGDDIDDLMDTMREADGTASGGSTSTHGDTSGRMLIAEGFVTFRFGDHVGRVSTSVYRHFTERYHAIRGAQRQSGTLLDDILRVWLGIEEGQQTSTPPDHEGEPT